jgi:hypothetical protein
MLIASNLRQSVARARKPHLCAVCQKVGGVVLVPEPEIRAGSLYRQVEERAGAKWVLRWRVCATCWDELALVGLLRR